MFFMYNKYMNLCLVLKQKLKKIYPLHKIMIIQRGICSLIARQRKR